MNAISPIAPAGAANTLDQVVDLQRLDAGVDGWARQYQTAAPYPHIVIPDFLKPGVVERLIDVFPPQSSPDWAVTHDATGHFEQKFNMVAYEKFPDPIRNFFDIMNSRPILEFLEQLTGIDGLIPDPHFYGGGLHMLKRGGRLGLHVDFNRHKKMQLDRRLNALLYLNPVWKPEWKGELELWNEDVSQKVASYPPIANQLLVFSTTEKSYHGHPDPLECPEDVRRRSLALYYYTNGRPEEEQAADHTTRFKLRPGEKQKWSPKVVAKQLTPPFLWEMLAGRK
ncbi:hypothetical protein ASG29_00110 [Sphingomonas sp. Leaf412]|uniref:2OG-Fe(II) oxygenase n=1 Tax=Sphingomonas sp. Leaf412 TaxID=1736370 RepID=UPI0006F3A183|nr:2OG-Fe(II) oxygenase [Sphingomonas sp. Leaf412]KQT34621.1 hypothetical protein ASG29_00110 [Sphingomonas sp. Leaf412]